MIVPPTRKAASDDFLLTAGLLQAHVLNGVSIERLAQRYGFTPARLRGRLLDHLSSCLVALTIEVPTALEPEPEPVELEPTPVEPPVPPAPTYVRRTRRRETIRPRAT